jgi:endonuclease/exonuclease/phosphatase (EEP) superfamily protein YafD
MQELVQSSAARRPSRWRRAFALSLALAVAALSATLFSARLWWLGELAVNFEFHVGVFAAAAALSLLLLRARWLAAASALLAIVHLAPDAWLLAPASHAGEVRTGSTLRVLSANVLQPNTHYDEIAAALRASDADVIGVLELSGEMRAVLERELVEWPHRVGATPSENTVKRSVWTTSLFSKLPLSDVRFVQLFDCYAPLIEARVTSGADSLLVRLVHLPRPGSGERVDARNAALEQLAEQFEWGPHTLLIGDLNTTSSSPHFAALLERTGLSDSRQGFGRQPSWWLRPKPIVRRAGAPDWLASLVNVRLGIAIDHALTGPGLRTAAREVIELPFSDHGGVLGDFSFLGPAR